ncbi:hypothetical protein ACSHT2_29285 [Bradyrhizobium sp. PUT101]|uniref:hypothetical protein n=1 Tax=Bradyrhizobium sp. PUT101 TaxID=3447427 RepID=UPI003F835C27
MKFMLQDLHVDDLNTLDQHYVGNFVDLMRSELSKNDGKLRANATRARSEGSRHRRRHPQSSPCIRARSTVTT